MSGARIVTRRRNNAPIRPKRRPATFVPDLLITLSVTAWVMAAIFVVATFTEDSLENNAGTDLARLFAGTLAIAGVCSFMIALLLLRDDRGDARHYTFPMILGAIIGTLEAIVFLQPSPALLFLPFLLLILVIPPFRRAITGLFRFGGGRK